MDHENGHRCRWRDKSRVDGAFAVENGVDYESWAQEAFRSKLIRQRNIVSVTLMSLQDGTSRGRNLTKVNGIPWNRAVQKFRSQAGLQSVTQQSHVLKRMFVARQTPTSRLETFFTPRLQSYGRASSVLINV